MIFLLVQLWILVIGVRAPHYKGGSITWKPVDPYTNSTSVDIIISEFHSWTLSRFVCTQSTINTLGWYSDNTGGATPTGPPIACQSIAASCTAASYSQFNDRLYCTDFSNSVQISSGAAIKHITLNRNTNIRIGFTGSAWASVVLDAAGVPANDWRVITRIDLTQKYPINTSPVTGSLPIIRVIENRTATIQIPAADWDADDNVRCRWASSTGAAGDECGDICGNLVGANLSSSECTITWYAVRRPQDISVGNRTSTYVVAIMVEDFVNTTSIIPMSSVPLQMLIYTYQPASGACSIIPAVIGDRPNRACIGVPIGIQLVERIVAQVYCSGDFIVEFITTSPLYMTKTAIAAVSGTTNQWYITLTWTPTIDQKGPQVFCAAPIDERGLTGSQHCINFVVGYAAPNLVTPILVQGSASPLGTVFANQSLFSIQATSGVYHPNRNGTYIQIFNRANPSTPAWQTDCGYSPYCIYSGQTILFYVQNANWTLGAHYYILFSSGAASGNIFCAPESAPIIDSNYWNFNIWDPGLSSTTTTTTTPPTTGTITTRGISTMTTNPNLTTTGIILTAGTTATTTTVTTSTTSSATTTNVGGGQLSATTEMDVVSAKDFEEQCKQPIAITTAVLMLVMLAGNMIGMFAMFTKLDKMFNPHRLAATIRQRKFINRVTAVGRGKAK